MAEYNGSIELISGITQKGGGTFPLAAAKDIQVDDEDKRLDEKLTEMDEATQKVEDELDGLVTSVPADFGTVDVEPDMSRTTTLGMLAIPTIGSTIKSLAARVTGAGTVRFALVSQHDSEDGTEGVLVIKHIFGDVVADATEDTATLTLAEGYKVEGEDLRFLITANTSIIGCYTANGMAFNKVPVIPDMQNLDMRVGEQIGYVIGKISPAYQPVIEVIADTITPATVQEFAENITGRVSKIEREGVGGGETEAELPAVSEEDNGKILSVVGGAWSAAEMPSSLPEVTDDDDGKVLSVAGGAWSAQDAPTSLPEVGAEDNGKVLAVDDGQWSVKTPDDPLPAVTEADNDKILTVVDGKWQAADAPATGGGVSSWNDLTDRPFYADTPIEQEILAPQTTAFTFMSGMDAHIAMHELTAEQLDALYGGNLSELVVVWGENTYHCQPNFTMGILAFGNVDLMMGTGNTGEPFIIAHVEDYALMIGDVETAPPEDTSTESTVERTFGMTMVLENIQTLDPKFIREVEWDKITGAPFGTIENMTVLFEGTPKLYSADATGETVIYYYIATPAVSVIPPTGTMIGLDYDGESGIAAVTLSPADEATANFTVNGQTFDIFFEDGAIAIATPLSEAPAVKIYLGSDVVIPLPEQYLPEIPGTLPEVTTADNDKVMQVIDGVWTPVSVADSAIKTYIDNYINEALGGDY